MWQIRMLGRFEVVSEELAAVSFRSRKVGSLLAFLALNRGQAFSNMTLQELLWPDSDGDRQSQSLRRAVADLRDALTGDAGRRGVIRTEHGTTNLAEDLFECDTDRFERLLSGAPSAQGFEVRATEAIALYGGPLLAPLDDDWIFAYRRKFEEMYCRSVVDLCHILSAKGQGKEAVRIANSAIVLAPLREEPFIASIQAYASMGNQAMAIQQYEALEKMLDGHFGETPSEQATAALGVPNPKSELDVAPAARTSGGPAEVSPGGASTSGLRFYIVREADGQVLTAIQGGEAVVLAFGPRQVGKTSLLARTASIVRPLGVKVAVTDFQALGKNEVVRPVTLYRALVHSLASQLELSYEPSWNEWIGPNSNLDSKVDAILRQTEGQVCWMMDEVDRLFGTDYSDDFFGLVRSWHNRRALDPAGPWRRLSLLISYATEAHLFIKDLNQSPFNVGIRANLSDFSEDEVGELGRRHGSQFAEHSDVVYALTHGHPFLTRRAFTFLQGGRSVDDLQSLAPKEEGPFGDHLKRILTAIHKDPQLEEEVHRILHGEALADRGNLARLIAAGLLSDRPGNQPSFRVPLYESYLRSKVT